MSSRVHRDLDSRATEGFLSAVPRGFDLLADAAAVAIGSAAFERRPVTANFTSLLLRDPSSVKRAGSVSG